jgi:hypothetical protein
MGLTVKLNWFREDVVLPEGACEEGMEILKALGYSEREYVEAEELYEKWMNSDTVPRNLKPLADRYKKSKDGLEAYVLKKHKTLDVIVEKNDFKIKYLGQNKTCKTLTTLKKYQDEMINRVYDNATQYKPFVYVEGSAGTRVRIEPENVKMYAKSNVSIIIEDYHNNEKITSPQEFSADYEEKVLEAKKLISETEIEIFRMITDPDEFFEVWVPYSI